MIRNIIFDFGNVFVDLDMDATIRTLRDHGFSEIPQAMYELAYQYEKGLIPTSVFLAAALENFPGLSEKRLVQAWNAILLGFPSHRMEFLEDLAASRKHRLFLLSNSNALHIQDLTKRWGKSFMDRFFTCFQNVYFSHHMGMRKPEPVIYQTLMDRENILAGETIFVDDLLENIQAAAKLGLETWHLQVGLEDIVEIQSRLT